MVLVIEVESIRIDNYGCIDGCPARSPTFWEVKAGLGGRNSVRVCCQTFVELAMLSISPTAIPLVLPCSKSENWSHSRRGGLTHKTSITDLLQGVDTRGHQQRSGVEVKRAEQ